VEPEGVEPSSKQAITMLSSCLVFDWFSWGAWPKTAQHNLSFFIFKRLPKP